MYCAAAGQLVARMFGVNARAVAGPALHPEGAAEAPDAFLHASQTEMPDRRLPGRLQVETEAVITHHQLDIFAVGGGGNHDINHGRARVFERIVDGFLDDEQ